MPDNVLRVGPQLYSVLAGVIVLFVSALVFAFRYRNKSDKAASRGHRPSNRADEGQIVAPDGFIDTFAGVIAEAGGSIPLMATIIMVAVLVSWFVYLIVNWQG